MNRRNAISNIVLLSIGAMVLPSCHQEDGPLVKLNNFSITAEEEKMLAQLADTIVAPANFNSEDKVDPHGFLLMMVDDCYEPAQQKKFTAGLKEFNKEAKEKYGEPFAILGADKRKAWLATIESKKDISKDVLFFYETTKRHTVQALTSSPGYMANVLKYKMVPGSNFKGCVPVKKA